jgi:hypothetical protein
MMVMKRFAVGIGALLVAALVVLHPRSSPALSGGTPTFASRIPAAVIFDPLPIEAQQFALQSDDCEGRNK